MLLDWDREIQWCLNHFADNTPDDVLKKLALNSYFYHIWAERNTQCLKVPNTAQNRTLFNRWSINVSFILHLPIECAWKGPDNGEYMINSDGSLAKNGARYGAIVRDHLGNAIVVVIGNFKPMTITVYELQGIEAGLKMAVNYNLKRIYVGSDSKAVVSLFSKKERVIP
ncbi:Ribonuclease H domain [Macleaya cordata]|uniref:Ribonuclease H domain n=1 Tax=Macleaya cordata TaxID=56857 RepID=A0A200PXY1_MACCD|nr:Ribonuclease H domain [Macleaya cordata]